MNRATAELPHGISRYKSSRHPCRCPVCRAANADHSRAYRARPLNSDRWIVDRTAVDRAISGERVRLNRAEQREAIRRLVARGMSRHSAAQRVRAAAA